jgi:nucleoside-diphosphate-sugar epimerase
VRIAVTGINGFLGLYLKNKLEGEKFTIIPIQRSMGHDLTQPDTLSSIPEADVLVHLAAVSFVPDSYKRPQLFYNTNFNGTLNALELARKWKSKFIYLSSYVYGEPEYQPIDEDHPVKPFNPYAQSKVLAEELVKAYHRDFEVPVIILRPFNIYGRNQGAQFLIPKIIGQFQAGDEITVFDPRPKRDYVHVEDVAQAIVNSIHKKDVGCHVFNIGTGISWSVPDICNVLEEISGRKLQIKSLNQLRATEILDTKCNYDLAQKELAWKPMISFKEGLRDMLS